MIYEYPLVKNNERGYLDCEMTGTLKSIEHHTYASNGHVYHATSAIYTVLKEDGTEVDVSVRTDKRVI